MGFSDYLTSEEIERRLIVWEALSDLFVATEIDICAHRYIAERLRESGFSLVEIEDILCNEVAPAFYDNLLGFGEWKGWSRETVKEIILEKMRNIRWYEKIPPIRKRLRKWQMSFVENDWNKVRSLLEDDSKLEDVTNEQLTRGDLWESLSACGHWYLHKSICYKMHADKTCHSEEVRRRICCFTPVEPPQKQILRCRSE